MSFSVMLRKVRETLFGSRARQAITASAALIAFLAAIATLYQPVKQFLWPTDFRVYVIHPQDREQEPTQGDRGVWERFRAGVDDHLRDWQGRLDGPPVSIRDEYKLSFQARSWRPNDEKEYLRVVNAALQDSRAIAIVAGTNSHEAELLLDRLREETDPPLVLLATATKDDLLVRRDTDGTPRTVPGVFRMVPRNEIQARRLADTILSPTLAPCSGPPPDPIAVAILREEATNAAFSRDLSHALRDLLKGAQDVEILVDAAVDSLVTVPKELLDLKIDFLVYIGSQTGAARVYGQLTRLRGESSSCLPRLLLTDAGLLDEQYEYSRGLVPSSLASLPLTEEATRDLSAGFKGLGEDSAMLIREAAQEVQSRLSRSALKTQMAKIDVAGEAHRYHFKHGENENADFHLWMVSENGTWHHDATDCNSDFDNKRLVENHQPRPRPLRASQTQDSTNGLRIGLKPFVEQRILASLAVQILRDSGIPARLGRMSLNGIRNLLQTNRIDGYWEYTGTALHRHFGLIGMRGETALQRLRQLDASRMVWLSPLPINNTFLLLARHDFANSNNIATISDLARHLAHGRVARLCANSAWLTLRDGLKGLQEHYEFNWPSNLITTVDPAVRYDLEDRACDVLLGYATDARAEQTQRVALEDDRRFFSDYRPAFVLREDVYSRLQQDHSQKLARFEQGLDCLAQHLDLLNMRRLNQRVEVDDQAPEAVARDYLQQTCPPQLDLIAKSISTPDPATLLRVSRPG
jgi:osmoprotectant transport system substrate-binding protein